jgi:hypothetical protein
MIVVINKPLELALCWIFKEQVISRYSGGLWAGWIGFDPGTGKRFSLVHIIQINSVVQAPCSSIGTVGDFPKRRAAGA